MEKSQTSKAPAKTQAPRDDVQLAVNRCPFCHDGVEAEQSVVCRDCLARHHPLCWEEGTRCSSCGSDHLLQAAPRRITDALVRDLLRERGYGEAEISSYLSPAPPAKSCHWSQCEAPATMKTSLGPWSYCYDHALQRRRMLLLMCGISVTLFTVVGLAITVGLAVRQTLLFLIPAAVAFAVAVFFAFVWRQARSQPLPEQGKG